MDINKKIKELAAERNWSIYTLSLEAGLTQSTLTSMLQRNTPPKIETLQSICDAFGISISQFFCENESMEIVNKKEKELLRNFRNLNKCKQDVIISLLKK